MSPLQAAAALGWDYAGANTKTDTHCYHAYPAMMIPQIARRLIADYGKGAKTLFDPYCGTGTSLVEATLQGINAHGADLNPLARLIAEAKTTRIEPQTLDLYLKAFHDFLFSLRFGRGKSQIAPPNFPNIDFWHIKAIIQSRASPPPGGAGEHQPTKRRALWKIRIHGVSSPCVCGGSQPI